MAETGVDWGKTNDQTTLRRTESGGGSISRRVMHRLRDTVSGQPIDRLEEDMLRDSGYWMDERIVPGTLRRLVKNASTLGFRRHGVSLSLRVILISQYQRESDVLKGQYYLPPTC
jgi:hypothetical protein